ncbi:MAG: ferrous iron transport protein B [Pyrinomonadaceae bacterium]|nr:ferrous iron transport protein B [Blastocatellia bacterium]MCW5958150.1 ferrous iron transport protein B [Pyrinomonadaceae bacterium]
MKDAAPQPHAFKQLNVALAGNPNAGKTTLFNALTGLNQKVANYPGVTVERKHGVWSVGEKEIKLIDLPGLYSLEATSLDEQIASDVLLGKIDGTPKPDAVIAVVDATNLERNLYLVTQLFEYGIPVVVALTMIDVFERQKHEIDIASLSRLLKVPVVAVNAADGRGAEELESRVEEVIGQVQTTPLEIDADAGENAKIFARYSFISDAVQRSVKHNDKSAHDMSEKIDKLLTHRFFGLAILVGVLLLVFQSIFSWAEVPMHLLEQVFGAIGDGLRSAMPEGILADLLVDGIIAGVGGVLVFLPQILLLFLFVSLLEDSGYMARAAFLMDKLMSRVGLHGKAFLPLMSSFACAIPGIMATRTIENQRDRFATILIAPFMSCSARLPVYTLMIGAFFAGQTVFGFISLGALLMLAMYSIGIAAAIIVAFILKHTILKSPPPPFVMELPPYRVPNLRTVVQNMITRAWLFVKRAGTVILAISIILWALAYFPRTGSSPSASEPTAAEAVQMQNSYAGQLGHLIEPVIQPLGFDWKIGVALIASFAAREVLVSTLSIIYNVGKDENEESTTLIAAIRDAKDSAGKPVWTPLTALTLMVFFVLAMQCMSTLAVVRRETNSWRWPLFMLGYMTCLAYLGAFLTYQGGKLVGLQ